MRAAGDRTDWRVWAGRIGPSLAYFVLFVLLDNLAYRRAGIPDDTAIVSLNSGLSYILVLKFGNIYLPAVILAPVLAELVLDQSRLPGMVELLRDLSLGATTALALLVLTSRRMRFDPALASLRDLATLLAIAALEAAAATGLVSLAQAFGAERSDPVSVRDILDLWVAHFLGVVMVAPLGIVAIRNRWHILRLRDWLLHLAAILAVFLTLAFLDKSQPFQSFYVLSLPIIWMAARGGIEAASVGLAVTQVGLIVASQTLPNARVDIPELQARLLVLTVTGLVIGALVVERLRFERQLRQHQEAVERMARIASMGQLASSIAHEINQPLMAAGTYSRLVTSALAESALNIEDARRAAEKSSGQITRAGDVVRRLRALFKLDTTLQRPHDLGEIIANARSLCLGDLTAKGISCKLRLPNPVPLVMADQLQIEQVFVNLIQNAAQAMESGGQIGIEVLPPRDGLVDAIVSDSGPGLPVELINGVPIPFFSTKETGIGVGLALSRTIVEAHDGLLRLGNGTVGARIVVSLPAG
ncbi:ATP-binding protein [Rhabdaerophilum sp. SD176]|uniref:ATP-binding protein n=1 Tax=Rhabdaerophilum sp. SD176 TaxID=2983548 RepID=UPI0024DF7B2F|nr:ATP-binding protein [Rhabdaerophilum sp. SD176]